MKPDLVVLRMGELTLKGKNRSKFENRVIQHIQTILRAYPQVALHREYGRLYLRLHGAPYEPIAEQLRNVFGLFSFSPAVQTALDPVIIQQAALELVQSRSNPPATFKVEVKRVNKLFPMNTPELARFVGGYILPRIPGLKVDVRKPELQLVIEIREDGAYLFDRVEAAPGGFPLGTNGKAMLMLSGGIDSPVAGWYAMRKGLKLEAVHFHSYPYTSERAKHKVRELASQLAHYSGCIRLHMVPLTEIQLKLKQNAQENLLVTHTRRAMYRLCERLAEREGARAIVTGESLGQVASQTLPSLDVIGRASGLPLLRPLIMMDKQEIIPVAERIGTFDLSIQPYEDCCTLFLPRSPSTNPNVHVVERQEAVWGWYEELLNDAIARTETELVFPGGPQLEEDDQDLF
ncbi:tRNA uracil 4-sulfurtransferase ThiI [Paenibacillus sp. y28]|uniref:tRNA uracil 4-sulfurtransferase ThiI n=1 Tax=Paenibacillus sp. y28 TaxID=3129110 RepID=UPI0030195DBB